MLLGAPSLRLVLFGGRGGVGKTSVATAAALAHADACAEQRCALISVDPAHSIRDCLANAPLPANLDVIEFDAAAALTRFKAERGPLLREVARRGTFLDDEDIDRFLDLSLPGLDEFMALLELAAMTERGDHARVFVDTAPIGHTLRLLSAPAALLEWLDALDALLEKHRYMREVFSGARRADDADLMIADLRRRTEALRELLASAGARFIAVVVPEPLCLQETATLLAEVSRLGVRADAVIVNHLRAHDGCPRCERIALDQRATLEAHPAALEGREVFALPELAAEARGREPLRALWRSLHELSLTAGRSRDPLAPPIVRAAIARAQVDVELVFVVGKGGVGKTTIACALALDAARRGEQVALISTDPAPSLATCLATTIDATPRAVADGLIAQVIDAPAEWTSWQALYRDELAASFGEARGFELRFDRQALERTLELSPPGIEEIVAVTRVLDILDSARSRLVVDT
ncbi:MAG: TRC40/GET3/ArsA family transport-energizing ATPase, partial [Myxococcales bacterium]|nr:TRC40/GET3/ArsA family transport-energizing ATPase [Myxococcales bacterium]